MHIHMRQRDIYIYYTHTCVYMYVYVNVYVRICIFEFAICICNCMYVVTIYIYIYIYMSRCMQTDMHTHSINADSRTDAVRTCTHVFMHTYVQAHINKTCIHIEKYVRVICTSAYIYIYIYIIYIHIHIYVHMDKSEERIRSFISAYHHLHTCEHTNTGIWLPALAPSSPKCRHSLDRHRPQATLA